MAQLKKRPSCRSVLFTPGNVVERVRKALTTMADVVAIDLEDAVPFEQKQEARACIVKLKDDLASASMMLLVRVNSIQSRLVEADLRSLANTRLDGILIPKVEASEHLTRIASLLRKMRMRSRHGGSPYLWPIVESPRGLLNVEDIANASPMIQAICFGAIDYTRELGCDLTKDPNQTLYARSRIAATARAFDRWAIDTVFPDFNDDDGLLRDCQIARNLGFNGKLVIHPRQIDAVNSIFTISVEQIERARRVIEAFEIAQASGRGATSIDGEMIDRAAYDRARQILASAKTAQV